MGDMPSFKSLNSQKHKKGNQFQNKYKSKSAYAAKTEAKASSAKNSTAKAKLNSGSLKLPSNWEKYERSIDEPTENEQVLGIDINTLAVLPTSNSQFQLKQDKVFLPRSDSTINPGEIFELDMNLLNLSLSTIPYYKRMGIDQSILPEDAIQVMNRKALDANSVYHKYLAKQANMPSPVLGLGEEPSLTDDEEYSNCDEIEIRTDDLVHSPGALSDVTEKDLETKELEDWLNDVL